MSSAIQDFLRNELGLSEEFTSMDEVLEQAIGGEDEEHISKLRAAILEVNSISKEEAANDLAEIGRFLDGCGYRLVKEYVLERIEKHKQLK
jgi:hypothetical protein